MALPSIIRSAVKIADKITKPMQPGIIHRTWTGQSGGTGDEGYVDVLRKAIFEEKIVHMKVGERFVWTKGKLTFLEVVTANPAVGRKGPIDPKDRFLLPNGTTGMPLNVDGLWDGTGATFLKEVWLE